MSADEIRRLADSNAIHRPKCRTSEKFPRCREWCPSEDSKKCKEADEVRAALLAYAAMVEWCEKIRAKIMDRTFRRDIGWMGGEDRRIYTIIGEILQIAKGATNEQK